MVFVKVRETYDLKTTKNKMTVIGIHTPKPDIIKKNYPGLLMQCKAYRPVSADVVVACASVLPLDPLKVGTDETDISPEDLFNPILYKAISNKGMASMEARIAALGLANEAGVTPDLDGASARADVDDVTNYADEFPIYYGILANSHGWKHANPQQGLEMRGLKPLVFEMVYNIGDSNGPNSVSAGPTPGFPAKDGSTAYLHATGVPGNAKPFPFINCLGYGGTGQNPGFDLGGVGNYEQDVNWLNVMCGAIIIPPARLHEFYYRMTIEWTLEFSSIRPIEEVQNYGGLAVLGASTHYQNYSYEATKEAITGEKESVMDQDACMVAANVDVKKVM